MVVSKVILLTLTLTYTQAGYTQFHITPFSQNVIPFPFASHQPPVPQFYQSPFVSFAQGYQAPFVSQHFSPFIHQTYHNSFPQQNVITQNRATSYQASGRSLDLPQSESNQGSEYGFGYRTQYDDGATSMVVFVTGPESQKVNLARRKPSARKLSSDILDVNTTKDKDKEISNALTDNLPTLEFQTLLQAYPVFKELEQPKTSVLHLYSHPANVISLSNPNSTPSSTTEPPSSNSSSEGTNNDNSDSVEIESSETVTSTPAPATEEKEAESIIQETKIRINNIQNRNSEETSSTTSTTESPVDSTSTSSTSTTSTTSTEESNDASTASSTEDTNENEVTTTSS
ncbi:hypothetical protein HHI36_011080 [Cryptolaemus montrouzieri]|uniref:Uncharacterized protein n=1 Tax=Cryptolaemus montrouzieri TaxID=559131 RepID=A0ABD2MKR5_9CUCU